MRDLLERATLVAECDARVLITGESGTGKQLLARFLHEHSDRRARSFVVVSCEGAGEDARSAPDLEALIRTSGGSPRGTLLLDEVAELPPGAQARLLSVLEDRGQLETAPASAADARVVAATRFDLRARVRQGRFREDLFYRLNVVRIDVPPLRERAGDVPALCEHFAARDGVPGVEVEPAALSALSRYGFPGNVRELEHAVQQALILSRGERVSLAHLPDEIAGAPRDPAPSGPLTSLEEAVSRFERAYLVSALRATEGRRADCARLLGISRKTLWKKLSRYDVDEGELS